MLWVANLQNSASSFSSSNTTSAFIRSIIVKIISPSTQTKATVHFAVSTFRRILAWHKSNRCLYFDLVARVIPSKSLVSLFGLNQNLITLKTHEYLQAIQPRGYPRANQIIAQTFYRGFYRKLNFVL